MFYAGKLREKRFLSSEIGKAETDTTHTDIDVDVDVNVDASVNVNDDAEGRKMLLNMVLPAFTSHLHHITSVRGAHRCDVAEILTPSLGAVLSSHHLFGRASTSFFMQA